MTGYTFVTVAHDIDLPLLQLQARSFRRHVSPQYVDRIVLIQNADATWTWDDIADSYGAFNDCLQIAEATALCALPKNASGWWTQQILKLAVAKIVDADRYIVLDAKNHWVSPPWGPFFEAGGKPRIRRYSYREHPLRERLERALRYFLGEVDTGPYIDGFLQTSTPFTFLTASVLELMNTLSLWEGKSFPEAFVDIGLTEFFAYSAFLLFQGRRHEDLYHIGQPMTPCIWPGDANPKGCLAAIRQAEEQILPLFAVHRGAIAGFDGTSREILGQFWHRRRLFPSIADAVYFLRHY